MAAHDEESSLVLVVGYEGSDPARRALAAAGRILRDREGWIEVVYVGPTEGGAEDSAGPAATASPRAPCPSTWPRCTVPGWSRAAGIGTTSCTSRRPWERNWPTAGPKPGERR